MAREHRLRRARDFQGLWRSRWAARHPALTLRLARSEQSPGRVGIVVSRAVAKKAVDRNRLKRRLRVILAGHSVPAGIDAAIITHPGARALTYDELRRIVHQLFHQAFAAPSGRRRFTPVPKNAVA